MTVLKGILKSKTIWGNIIAILAILYTLHYGEPIPQLDAQTQAIIIAIYNVIIRFFTQESLYRKGI